MSPVELIAECARRDIILTPALDYDGPAGAMSPDVEKSLRAGKAAVIRALVGPATTDPRDGPVSTDWRFEWLRETGMLALRWRDAQDHDVKALLRELLAETPRTLPEWLCLGQMICDAEASLRRAGRLPPVPNFGP